MADAPKFEEGLAALEKLVAELETGDLGLDEALKRFETGVKLAGKLQSSLELSQRRVEQLAAGKLEEFGGAGGPEPAGEAGDGGPSKKPAKKKASDGPSLF